MRVIFAASEIAPYAKTGGLADVAGSLPKALQRKGAEVLTVLPRYGTIPHHQRVLDRLEVPFAFETKSASVWSDDKHGFPVYFIDLPEYFVRPGIYGDSSGTEYRDNAERFGFFSRAVLELTRRIGFKPDIVHGNDWQTGLLPLYLHRNLGNDPYFAGTGSLFTIHNLAYQGLFDPSLLPRLGLGREVYDPVSGIEFHGAASSLKAGIIAATAVSTVSRRYALEIQTPEYGCRLDGLLRSRHHDLVGILNGVDYDDWDPRRDPFLARNYSPEDLSGKEACRQDLLRDFQLSGDAAWPIVGCISRLVDQKGFDLISEIAGRMMQLGLYFVVLGSGDRGLESFFQALRDAHPDRVGVYIGFNHELAHKIEAGADLFLMPSKYEPCGLNQMYSLRYGTVPIVRATGGLDDTVQDFDRSTLQGNGFKFFDYEANRLLEKIYEALLVYADRPLWEILMRNGMTADFSWDRSALEYLDVYARLRSAVTI
ncbi:MAG: glycogen synthase GlgA [Acidobacteria bacterium]|nr:glycogen synthase GlgA [Acidobacteriota bacterium]